MMSYKFGAFEIAVTNYGCIAISLQVFDKLIQYRSWSTYTCKTIFRVWGFSTFTVKTLNTKRVKYLVNLTAGL